MTRPDEAPSPSIGHPHRTKFGLLIIAFFVNSVMWSFVINPNWGPDEGSHFEYIRYVITHGTLPVYGQAHYIYDPSRLQVHANQPPLYYLLTAPVSWVLGGTSTFWQIIGLRLLSVLLGTMTIGLLYLLGRQLFPARPNLALMMAAFMGFTPMFTYMSAVVNTDNLINLVTMAWLNWLIFGLRHTPNRKWLIVLGILLGIGLITKYSIVPAVIVSAVALAVLAYRRVANRLRLLLSYGIWAGGTALFISGWMFARNLIIYKDLLNTGRPDINQWNPYAATGSIFEMIFAAASSRPPFLITLYQSFAGVFDYMEGYMPSMLYVLFGAIILVGVAGTAVVLPDLWKRRRGERGVSIFLFEASCLLLLGITTFLFICNYSYRLDYQPQGRYLFIAFAPVSVVVVFGWDRLACRMRVTGMAAPIIVITMITLNILSLITTLIPLEHARYLRTGTANPLFIPQPLAATNDVTIPYITRQEKVERLDVLLNVPSDYTGDITWKIERENDGVAMANAVTHIPGAGLGQYHIQMPANLEYQSGVTYALAVRASESNKGTPSIYVIMSNQHTLPNAADMGLRVIYPSDLSMATLQQMFYELRSAPLGTDRTVAQTILVPIALAFMVRLTTLGRNIVDGMGVAWNHHSGDHSSLGWVVLYAGGIKRHLSSSIQCNYRRPAVVGTVPSRRSHDCHEIIRHTHERN